MEQMAASCALSLVMAKKLTGQHTNGDVEEAMQKAATAQEEYADTLIPCVSKKKSGALEIQELPFWRSRRDSNPRAAFDGHTISSRARYDHFDTTPNRRDSPFAVCAAEIIIPAFFSASRGKI